METMCFDNHNHAFKVKLQPKVLHIIDLIYLKPFNVQIKYGTTDIALYVVPHCHFMQT